MTTGAPNAASEQMTFEQLRRELPITEQVRYFYTGGYGPTPDSVLKVVANAMEFDNHLALASAEAHSAELEAKETAARKTLASFLHVEPEELALTPNATQSMLNVIRNVRWQPGDEIVLSSQEHVNMVGISQTLESQYGVVYKTVPCDQGDGAFLEQLDAALTSRSRLLLISHITSGEGRRLPVAEATEVAHRKGVPVAVDGAQAVGVFPVDVASIGCDYYIGNGHKWLLGPRGTGFLCIAADQIKSFWANPTEDVHPWTLEGEPRPVVTASTRVERGTHNSAPIIGLGRAVEIMSELGMDAIAARVACLSKILREEAAGWSGVRVLTPMEPERSAGITTLAFDGYIYTDTQALVKRLYDNHNILVKTQWLTAPSHPDLMGMRISIAPFNTEDEVHGLVDALREELAG